MQKNLVVIRGGGDIATGTIHRLTKSGFKVVILEIDKPTVIRRTVSFAQSVFDGYSIVEEIKTVKVNTVSEAFETLEEGNVPLLIDGPGKTIKEIKPYIVVDAILAKRNLGTHKDLAPIVIGLGPGFEAGKDVHAVIETNRGHNLGRVILNGSAEPNTGIPGKIEGFSWQRVIRSPEQGIVKNIAKIGDVVNKGQIIAYINDKEVLSPLDGVLRGLIHDGLEVTKDFKIGDVDPRGEIENCYTISDKARSIAGGVLEAILHLSLYK